MSNMSGSFDEFKTTPSVYQQKTTRMAISLKELSNERARFNVDPAFQRQEVWSSRIKQAFIDSLLLGKSIPPLTGYIVDNEATGERSYVITDGHQRITTILEFIDGMFKTWTPGQKRHAEPGPKPPVEPGRIFLQMSVGARNNLLDYHIDLNLEVFESDAEITTHFLRMNNQVPLSAAERLNAYKSKAKEAANRIEQHPFWDDFYTGKVNRMQLFQCGLQLLAIELSAPTGILDLQSGIFFHRLAAGNRDKDITDTVVDTIMKRLTTASSVFHGTQFTKRGTVVVMYQSIMFLEQARYTFQPSDKGKLAKWMNVLINESKRPSGVPSYAQPMQTLLRESAQKAFWKRNLAVVMRHFGINDTAA